MVSEIIGVDQGPDYGSIGLLAQVFPRDVVDAAIDRAGVKELKNRALPARLMVYFVIAMWLWSGIRLCAGAAEGYRERAAGSRRW